MTRSGKIPSQAGFEPRIFRSRGGRQRGGPLREESVFNIREESQRRVHNLPPFSTHQLCFSSYILSCRKQKPLVHTLPTKHVHMLHAHMDPNPVVSRTTTVGRCWNVSECRHPTRDAQTPPCCHVFGRKKGGRGGGGEDVSQVILRKKLSLP